MSRIIKAVVIGGVAAALVPALWRLADFGRTNEYAGHAMFVPLFAALIAWHDRDRLRATAGAGHVRGLVLLGGGVGLAALGSMWKSDVVQAVAIAVVAAGAVLWLWGPACLKAAAFPVVFLVMMAPLPRPVVAAVTAELQSFAAGFATRTVQLIGVPVHHVGATLELSTMTLEVAEVCNGLRFLMAIVVLTAAFAQIMLPTWQRRAVLVLSSVPIAVLANAVRVAAIAIGVHYVGPDAAKGTVHDWIGKSIWAITLLPMIGLGVTLARFHRPAVLRASQGLDAATAGKTGVA